MRSLLLAQVLLVAACATARSTASEPVQSAPVPPAAEVDAAAPIDAEAPPVESEALRTLRAADGGATPEAPYLGVLDRAGLSGILDQGLGRVLARLKLSPVLERGKFQGFRVNAVDPAWSEAGLLAGDVLLRLNGQPIERPEQAQVAFESLRVASELALELVRDRQKMLLRYRIEGTLPTSSASAPQ